MVQKATAVLLNAGAEGADGRLQGQQQQQQGGQWLQQMVNVLMRQAAAKGHWAVVQGAADLVAQLAAQAQAQLAGAAGAGAGGAPAAGATNLAGLAALEVAPSVWAQVLVAAAEVRGQEGRVFWQRGRRFW